jgi:hypothetical protein
VGGYKTADDALSVGSAITKGSCPVEINNVCVAAALLELLIVKWFQLRVCVRTAFFQQMRQFPAPLSSRYREIYRDH